jgi:glucose-6-phosphate dehydrogenase assembly protein OpcA
MALDTSLLGQPVELGQISRELKKLWETSGGSKSRASLINLVVYCEGTEALEANTRLISEFTRDHACRAILVANVAESQPERVQAWINAHCHLPRVGAKQVCCEQITFVIEKASERLLANSLFANLDSDLPLYLWWQGDFTPPFEKALLTRVDRLIYDSSSWSKPLETLEKLSELIGTSGSRAIPCDLDWTRSLHLRQAVAQMFDHPENLAQIPKIKRLTVAHASGHRNTALLAVAWVAAQLRWTAESGAENQLDFRSPEGTGIIAELKEVEGAPISSCVFDAEGVTVAIHREPASPHHKAEVRIPDGRVYQHVLPAGSDDLCSLLDEELTRGGKHRVYLKALQALMQIAHC